MKAKFLLRVLTVTCLLHFNAHTVSQAQTTDYRPAIPVSELQQDFQVLKNVLTRYHPGLLRYQDSATIQSHFTALEKQLAREMSTREFYLLLSRFTAQLKCGHTFCSYFNQGKGIKDSLFNVNDKLPFTFFLYDKKMFIDKDLSAADIQGGAQIISINKVPVKLIIDSLLPYVKGDGGNDGKRLIDLELSGLGKYEAFDIFFPLLFPPVHSAYAIEYRQPNDDQLQQATVKTVSRAERLILMEQKYGKQPATLDDLWDFKILSEKTAYLKLGTFVTNKLTIDWKKFLSASFAAIKEKKIGNLIIDIRGNEGGDDEVNLVLARYLASKPIGFPPFKQLLKYETVAEEDKQYLNTWDKSFYDRSGKVINLNNGYYTFKRDRSNEVISQNKSAFAGKVFLLVNAANSSATFFLTGALQQNKIATVIGSETGGNLKGTNGGQLFFLWLPNSKIEIDVPLIGYYPLTEQPDKGLTPDITVLSTAEDSINKRDKALEKALALAEEP